ncbi:MAG: PAS domain S-box protein, partial [Gammaproteobacteria bacterium]|nr:PAS domain S-box protein [Gammaproteobacteria bacterium]
KEMVGYKEYEIEDSFDEWAELVHPEDLPSALEFIESYLNDPSIEFNMEFRMRHKDGHYMDILSRAFGLRDKNNRVLRIVGTHVDITERKRAERLLRESEQKFRTIFDSTGDAIMLLKDGHFIDCNRATLNIFGIDSTEEFCSFHPGELSPPQQPNGVDSMIMAEGQIALAMNEGRCFFEWIHRRKGGDDFPAEVLLTVMEIDGEQVIEATVRDISERKSAELMLKQRYHELEQAHSDLKDAQAQLLQSEKMASIGQLAAGVAHEINNPVGYVSSNISSLKIYLGELFQLINTYAELESELPDGEMKQNLNDLKARLDLDYLRQDVEDLVDESLEGVHRVKKIVQDLKDFSHVDEAEWQLGDLHAGLDSTLNIVHNELKYKAEVIKEYGEIPEIVCMGSQLNQVFMNMFINASHAIEDQGKVYVRTGQHDSDWVWVEIEDTGKGISPENLPHIFEPFFTTKEVGKGTGLGLSLTYGIIEKHHGRIEVESEVGVGTRFKIWLPIHNDEVIL